MTRFVKVCDICFTSLRQLLPIMHGTSPTKKRDSPRNEIVNVGLQSQAGETATVDENDFSDSEKSNGLNSCA
jgi:hypothetical protein